jgi:hypothetical protein
MRGQVDRLVEDRFDRARRSDEQRSGDQQ